MIPRRLICAAACGALLLGTAPTRARAAELTETELESLAFRTYLHARLGETEAALALADQVLRIKPDHVATHLAICSMWEAENEPERLHVAANRLLAYFPDHDQALYFKASAEYILRHYGDTRATLLQNRRINYPHAETFPYQVTLGGVASLTRDWRTAAYSDRHINDGGGDYDRLARNRRELDRLLREHLNRWGALRTTENAPSRYSVTDFHTDFASDAAVRARYTLLAGRTETNLVQAAGLAAATHTRDYAGARLDVFADDQWSAELGLAGDSDNTVALVSALNYSTTRERTFSLEAEYNTLSTDDATHRIANIRQSKITTRYADRWSERTAGSVALGMRSLHPAATPPEHWGKIISGEVTYTSPQRIPRLTPYLQTLWITNPANAAVDAELTALRNDGKVSSVSGSFDIQNAGLRTQLPLRRKWSLGTDTYVGTSILNGGILYGASCEVRWRATKTLSLQFGAGWDKGTLFSEFPSGIVRTTASADWHF